MRVRRVVVSIWMISGWAVLLSETVAAAVFVIVIVIVIVVAVWWVVWVVLVTVTVRLGVFVGVDGLMVRCRVLLA